MKYYLDHWDWYGYDHTAIRTAVYSVFTLTVLVACVAFIVLYAKGHTGLSRNQAATLMALKTVLATVITIGSLAFIPMMFVPEALRIVDIKGMEKTYGITMDWEHRSEWKRIGSESDEIPVHYVKDGSKRLGDLRLFSDEHGRYVVFHSDLENVI